MRRRLPSRLGSALALALATPTLAHAAPADGTAAIEEIVVTARAQKLYRVAETRTGKLPSDPLSSSVVITSINEQLIEDQGARDARDIYRNISGVSLFSYAGVTARGFRQEEIFFDGLRGDPYVGFNVPQLFNVAQVDFLKGPAGMLYGPGAPGGLFNYVTKKPSQEFGVEVRAIGGNFDRIGGQFEVTGALPIEGSAGRIGVFVENQDSFRVNANSNVRIYDAGVSHDFGNTTVILQATRYEQDQDGNRLRGVPVDDQGEFRTNIEWNHNEARDFLNLESDNLQAIVEGSFGSITWDAKLRYTSNSQEQEYHEPIQLVDVDALLGAPTDGTPDLVARQFRDQLREEEQLSFGANAIWSADFGTVQNRLLVGYEHFTGNLDFLSGRANSNAAMVERFLAGASLPTDIIPLSLTDPEYGVTQPENYAVTFAPLSETEQIRQGAYLLEEATLGKLTLVGGVRFDRFDDDSGGVTFEDDATTFRFGGVYRVRDDVSVFAQWAESYEPQDVSSQNALVGGPFDPTEGTIVEAGIKTALFDGRLQGTATVYRIERTNVLQLAVDGAGNPIDAGGDGEFDNAPLGEVTSEGFEFDLVADITADWVVTLAYAYNDTRITADNGSNAGIRNSVGDRFANAPEHQFGFWTRYQMPALRTAVAFGGDFVGERVSLSGQPVNDFFVFDATVIYSPGPFELLLRVDNLFDEVYAESGFIDRTGHFPGAPRAVFVEFIKEW